jgi:hypothetical protein
MSDLSGAAEGCVGLQGRRSVLVPSDRRFVRSRWFVNRAKVLCLLSLAGTWIWEVEMVYRMRLHARERD